MEKVHIYVFQCRFVSPVQGPIGPGPDAAWATSGGFYLSIAEAREAATLWRERSRYLHGIKPETRILSCELPPFEVVP